MNHRSPTNSRPWLDETLREEYRRANDYDELLALWPTEGPEALVQFGTSQPGIWLSKRWTPRDEIHHLCGGANGASRADVVSNLVAVSRTTHRWLEQFRQDGMALSMRCKIMKGEWQDDVMRQVFGLDRPGASVAEFIGRKGFAWPWVEAHWQFCREWELKQRSVA